MNDPYTEAPLDLDNREIRLVKLEHSTGSEPIKCSLRSYAIDGDSPAYIALSYAWGPKKRYDDIQLNGISFPIGRSLWSFLSQMRKHHQYITFWIDALSINQANILEQNHQVQMMRQIYSKAHSVWIWLGEADHVTHSDIAMQFLETREPTDNKEIDHRKFWNPKKARAIAALCERDYWKRIWIVQEILLAKKATILCGDKQTNWTKLLHLISDVQAISDRGRAAHTVGVSRVLESPAAVIVQAKSQWNGSRQPLTKLLELYRHQQSTDIRDKVYALHGLAHDSATIAVNYALEPHALLIEVIYHACSTPPFPKQSKHDMLRFATMMCQVLKVHCTEQELRFHISVARGEGIEKDYGLREKPELVIRHGTEHLQRFKCYRMGCKRTFLSSDERATHMRVHMRDARRVLGPVIEDLGLEQEGRDEVVEE
jgi:hypothetical protein